METWKKLLRPRFFLNYLLLAIPAAILLRVLDAGAAWVFAASCIAIVPLAGWMGRATEHLAARLGEGWGGFLNATFGNAAELIIALFALRAGLLDVVRASLTGSFIGNILLVLGASIVCGGAKRKVQRMNRQAAATGATQLAIATIGFVVPALFHATFPKDRSPVLAEHELSLLISGVLIFVYALGLYFHFRTHSSFLRNPEVGHDEAPGHTGPPWGVGRALLVFLVASTLVAVMSEFLVSSVEEAAHALGLTDLFVGVILVALVGNAAEHSTAVLVAMKDRIGLSYQIAVGSSAQVALFVAPVLVFASYAMGHPLDLVFTPFEVAAIALSVTVMALIALDGETHWFEGVMLLAVYAILGIAFFLFPG